MRENYPYGTFAVPLDEIVRIHSSSGTTGKQKVVGYTQKDIEIWAECCARSLASTGMTHRDILHVAYGYVCLRAALDSTMELSVWVRLLFPVSSGNTKRQITNTGRFQADGTGLYAKLCFAFS
jgi:phenylacetate-CoA ligase